MKNKMDKLKNFILYAGTTKEEYRALRPDIMAGNRVNLLRYSLIGIFIFAALIVSSFLYGGFTTVNMTSYVEAFVVMLIIFAGTRWIAPKYPGMIPVLMGVFIVAVYAFSIRISLLHAEKPAVTVIVFLLVVPILFSMNTVVSTLITVAVTVLFCVLAWKLKAPDVVDSDLWNTISYGMLAIVTNLFLEETNIRALRHTKKVAYLSETDLLTETKNRNCYESNLSFYERCAKRAITCIFADVNGLHELNNTKGHAAGDEMLKTVAKELVKCFGEADTYRIGGDEFVVFCVDLPIETIREKLEIVGRSVREKDYQVSFGVETMSHENCNIQELIRNAEENMYIEKEEYYRSSGKVHR